MRIVMLGPFGLHPKGTMRARALPAARALADRGHDVAVLMPPWHTPEEAGRRWVEADGRVSVEYISLRGLGWPVAGHLIVAARLARRALRSRPDVIHVFKPKAYGGIAGLFAGVGPAAALLGAGTARAPVVVDSDDWEGPGGWNDLEPYSRAQRAVFALQERHGLRRADVVTVASRALEGLAWSLGVPRDRVHYLPNALGEVPPARGPAPGRDRPPTVLLYTRFFEFDPERPLRVLDRLRRVVPGARLVVAGRGLFGEEAGLAALADRLGLSEAVQATGWLEPGDLDRWAASADVALYPFDDTLVNRTKSSVKVLELMARGLPVVADAVGELAQVVEPDRSGVLVPSGDVEAMADATAALLLDPQRRALLGAAARRRVAESFVWPRRVAALEAAYHAALPAHRRS